MRAVAWAVAAAIVLAGGTAHATQDHYQDITWVAVWADPAAIVVEITTWSPESEGKNQHTWWSFQQPAGVEQARIDEPYAKKPRLQRTRKSTLSADKLEAVVAALVAANTAKPRAKLQTEVATSLGLTALAAAKKCPARVRIGKRWISVGIGKVSADAGASVFPHPDVEMNWDLEPPATNAPSLKPSCFAHAGGVLVRFKLHASMEGDNYEDRIAYLPEVTLP